MPRNKVVRGGGETRQRILESAIRHFADASYDKVGLRDIAMDVGVDVAYVHRSFGSKENLFREVLQAMAAGTGRLPDSDPKEFAAIVAGRLFDRSLDRSPHGVDPLTILLRSASSTTAGQLAGERLQDDFIEPLRAKLGDHTQFRAAMILSLLIGFRIMRNLLQLPAVTEIHDEEAEAFVARAIDNLMHIPHAADDSKT